MDECHDQWVRDRGGVEDAEEVAVLGCGILTWGRQHRLNASGTGGDLVGMVRVVKVHPGPELYQSENTVYGERHASRMVCVPKQSRHRALEVSS